MEIITQHIRNIYQDLRDAFDVHLPQPPEWRRDLQYHRKRAPEPYQAEVNMLVDWLIRLDPNPYQFHIHTGDSHIEEKIANLRAACLVEAASCYLSHPSNPREGLIEIGLQTRWFIPGKYPIEEAAAGQLANDRACVEIESNDEPQVRILHQTPISDHQPPRNFKWQDVTQMDIHPSAITLTTQLESTTGFLKRRPVVHTIEGTFLPQEDGFSFNYSIAEEINIT